MKVNSKGVIATRCIFHCEEDLSLRIWPSGYFKCYGCDVAGKAENHPEIAGVLERVQHASLEAAGQMSLFG